MLSEAERVLTPSLKADTCIFGLSPVWKGILTQSFTARKLSNQKSTANIVSTTRKTTLCWLQAEIKELRSFISIDILNYISVWRSGRNEEGERRVIPPPPPHAVLVSAHFSFHRLLHQNAWMEQAIVALLVCDRKKEGHQNFFEGRRLENCNRLLRFPL